MARRDTLAPVELVEDDELDRQESIAPARRRRGRWWVLLVPVVVVGLAFAGQQLIDARSRAADARIAALPGAIPRVGKSLDVLWQTGAEDAPLAWGTSAVDGALHGVVVGPDGSLRYTALDVATGTHPWSTTLRGPDPALTDPLNSTTTMCVPEDDRAVCLVTDGYSRSSDDGTDAGIPATQAHVVVLDLADGSVLADHPSPPVSSLAVRPGLVATAVVDDQRHLVVVATDPMTGAELWRFRDPEPVRGLVDQYTASIWSAGDLVVLFNRPSGPLVLDASGQVVEPERDTDSWGSTDAGWLTWTRRNPDGPDPRVRVMRPGQAPLDVFGDLLTRSVDDGSVPGLEVSSGLRTYGWDSRTGKQLWQAHVSAAKGWRISTMILEGRVYLTTTTDVVALDGRDGSVVWSTPRPSGIVAGDLLTDGTHLYLVDQPMDPSGTGDLLVLDRHDGTALRRVPFPAGIASVSALGGRLVAGDEHGITGVG